MSCSFFYFCSRKSMPYLFLKINKLFYLAESDALNAITNSSIAKQIVVALNSSRLNKPARITLQNQQLKNQAVIPNCYGTFTLC